MSIFQDIKSKLTIEQVLRHVKCLRCSRKFKLSFEEFERSKFGEKFICKECYESNRK